MSAHLSKGAVEDTWAEPGHIRGFTSSLKETPRLTPEQRGATEKSPCPGRTLEQTFPEDSSSLPWTSAGEDTRMSVSWPPLCLSSKTVVVDMDVLQMLLTTSARSHPEDTLKPLRSRGPQSTFC